MHTRDRNEAAVLDGVTASLKNDVHSDPSDSEATPVVVSVIMPCLNEERTVAACVRKAHAGLEQLGLPGEVIVSDNGSTDDSVRAAREAGARVVHCPHKGYGHAIQYGVEHSRGGFLVMGDADESYDFSHLDRFVRHLQEGADLVMGNRYRGGIRPGAMPWKNRYLGTPVLTWITNQLFGTRIGDVNCGLRGFTRTAYERMQPSSSGMEFAPEMVVRAAKCRLQIVEVPTTLDPDGRGRAPHLRPWRDGWRQLKFLLMFSPLHLFLVPGSLVALIGLVLLLLPGSHSIVSGTLMLLIGIQVVQFGALARLYTATHRSAEQDPILGWLRGRLRVEHGLVLGGALFLSGIGIDGWLVSRWGEVPFSESHGIGPALLATGLMAVGVQSVFFAFLAGILNSGNGPKSTRSTGNVGS